MQNYWWEALGDVLGLVVVRARLAAHPCRDVLAIKQVPAVLTRVNRRVSCYTRYEYWGVVNLARRYRDHWRALPEYRGRCISE